MMELDEGLMPQAHIIIIYRTTSSRSSVITRPIYAILKAGLGKYQHWISCITLLIQDEPRHVYIPSPEVPKAGESGPRVHYLGSQRRA